MKDFELIPILRGVLWCSVILTLTACVPRTQFDAAVASKNEVYNALLESESSLGETANELKQALSTIEMLREQRDEREKTLKSYALIIKEESNRIDNMTKQLMALGEKNAKLRETSEAFREKCDGERSTLRASVEKATERIATLKDLIGREKDALKTANDTVKSLTSSLGQETESLKQATATIGKLDQELMQLRGDVQSIQGEEKRSQEKQLGYASEVKTRLSELKKELDESMKTTPALFKELSTSSKEALGAMAKHLDSIQADIAGLSREKAEQKRLEAIAQGTADIIEKLKQDVLHKSVVVHESEENIHLSLAATTLFKSGGQRITEDGKSKLKTVAEVLSSLADRSIRVYGHTDNIPVKSGAVYKNNLALSSLRASAVVSYLVELGVSPTNIEPIGLGELYPIADNASAEGRSQNRRITIMLLPKSATSANALFSTPDNKHVTARSE